MKKLKLFALVWVDEDPKVREIITYSNGMCIYATKKQAIEDKKNWIIGKSSEIKVIEIQVSYKV